MPSKEFLLKNRNEIWIGSNCGWHTDEYSNCFTANAAWSKREAWIGNAARVVHHRAAASRSQQREIVHIWSRSRAHCCKSLCAVWIPYLFQAPSPPASFSWSHKHVSRVYFKLITDNLHRISWWTWMSVAARHPTPLQTFRRMRMAFTSAPTGIMGYTKRC